MMVGLFLMLVVYVLAALDKKYDKLYVIKGFASTFWLISLFFILKFWPFTDFLLLISLGLTLASILYSYKSKGVKELKLLFISNILCLIFYIIPADTQYYLTNIKWSQEVETDFHSWDKYSWFLYRNARYDEASEASNKALKMAKNSENIDFVEFIKKHNEMIKNKTWTHYR